jgi:hypothetical protein
MRANAVLQWCKKSIKHRTADGGRNGPTFSDEAIAEGHPKSCNARLFGCGI